MNSGGLAFGQSGNYFSSDQVTYACVNGTNSSITKDLETPKTFPRGTSPISLNMVGPKGDQDFMVCAESKIELGERISNFL